MIKRIKHKDRVEYYNEQGQRHREDGPAVEWSNGTKEWHRNGQFHREDGPAIEYFHGSKEWYRNGERHREDGPAIERSNGEKEWYRNDKLHREDGPACEYRHGTKFWYLEDVGVKCFKYNRRHVCKEICIKCKRNTEDGCIGGLELCPFMMEQIVCKKPKKG